MYPVCFGANLIKSVRLVGAQMQVGVGAMLEEWQENLAIMAANRTAGDERVILHLGDCLWRARGEVGYRILSIFADHHAVLSCLPTFHMEALGKGVDKCLSVFLAGECSTHLLSGCRCSTGIIFTECKAVFNWC